MSERGGYLDPRTDREQLTTVAYESNALLGDRQQIYRFAQPRAEPITEWLYNLVGGATALGEPIIDVGTGSGQYLAALPDRRRIGMDLSAGMLAGVTGFGVPLVQADAQALPLRDRSAGTVMVNHMLYHVPDITQAAREARRVLRSGGLFLAVTNGRAHMRQVGQVLDDAIGQLSGETFHLDRSGERFMLEDGGDVLRPVFGFVDRHDRRAQLVVPEAEPCCATSRVSSDSHHRCLQESHSTMSSKRRSPSSRKSSAAMEPSA